MQAGVLADPRIYTYYYVTLKEEIWLNVRFPRRN